LPVKRAQHRAQAVNLSQTPGASAGSTHDRFSCYTDEGPGMTEDSGLVAWRLLRALAVGASGAVVVLLFLAPQAARVGLVVLGALALVMGTVVLLDVAGTADAMTEASRSSGRALGALITPVRSRLVGLVFALGGVVLILLSVVGPLTRRH
jgi:hypothetical protein